MTLRLLVGLVFLANGIAAPQAPSIQNGRVETRQTTAIDRELGAIAAGSYLAAGLRVRVLGGRKLQHRS